jgi:hypothetical protein
MDDLNTTGQRYRYDQGPYTGWQATGDNLNELFRTLTPSAYNVRNAGLQQLLQLMQGPGIQSALLNQLMPQAQNQYLSGLDSARGSLAARGMSSSGMASSLYGDLADAYTRQIMDAAMKAQSGEDQYRRTFTQQLGGLVNTDLESLQNMMAERGYGRAGSQLAINNAQAVRQQQQGLGSLLGFYAGNLGEAWPDLIRPRIKDAVYNGETSGTNNLFTNLPESPFTGMSVYGG